MFVTGTVVGLTVLSKLLQFRAIPKDPRFMKDHEITTCKQCVFWLLLKLLPDISAPLRFLVPSILKISKVKTDGVTNS